MNSKHLNTLFHTCKVIFVYLQVEIPQRLNITVTFPWSESVQEKGTHLSLFLVSCVLLILVCVVDLQLFSLIGTCGFFCQYVGWRLKKRLECPPLYPWLMRGERGEWGGVQNIGRAFEAIQICSGQETDITTAARRRLGASSLSLQLHVLLCIKEIRQRTEASGKGLWADHRQLRCDIYSAHQ